MKKKNLKSLALNRKTISNLDASKNTGGAARTFLCVFTLPNPNGVNTCLQSAECLQTQTGCPSILITCITQTEFLTCRDCE
ncbi:hypothetical protein [Kordia jejudonensis]|uniref:hypothetical protein n=1 Tax=Kordia jejudonensis TaxID=1348245 RepID=UPI000629643B|nr:hypothetical protein [Kordia jejudonensis]